LLTAVVEESLLGVVVADVVTGELGKLRERREKSNGRDVRPGLGQRERLDVLAQEGCIVALAKEIGFADGFVVKRGV
jgi:hypothetical protein